MVQDGIPTATLSDFNTTMSVKLLMDLSGEGVYYGDLQHIDKATREIKIIGDGACPPGLAGALEPPTFAQHGIPTEGAAGGLSVQLTCRPGEGVLARLGRDTGQFELVVTRCTVAEPADAEELARRKAECGIPFWPHAFVTARVRYRRAAGGVEQRIRGPGLRRAPVRRPDRVWRADRDQGRCAVDWKERCGMLRSVKDQVVVITGGSSGYGKAMARRLVEEGAKVTVTGRDESALKRTCDEIPGLEAYRADASKWEDWQRLHATVMERHGRIDVLVNNAGSGLSIVDTVDQKREVVDEIIAVNLTSTAYGSMIFGKQMQQAAQRDDHQHLVGLRNGSVAWLQRLCGRQDRGSEPVQGALHGVAPAQRSCHGGYSGRRRDELVQERRSAGATQSVSAYGRRPCGSHPAYLPDARACRDRGIPRLGDGPGSDSAMSQAREVSTPMNDHERILAYVDGQRDVAVDFLRRMVQFDSSTIRHGLDGQELAIQQWLEGALKGWGFTTRLFEPDNEKIKHFADFSPGHSYRNRPNLVATLTGTGTGRSLILNGHVDTMPAGDRDKWTHDPWGGEVDGGEMYGLGVCDMKAGVAAMILATRFLCEAGYAPAGDVMVQAVVDEEGGGNGTLGCVVEGYKADAAIVTEPTRLQVQPASRGVLLLEVDVEGRATHACLKWGGVNAIEKGVKIIQGMIELERLWLAQRRHPLFPPPTITIGQINGGLAGSQVPGECVLKFDVKYLPEESAAGRPDAQGDRRHGQGRGGGLDSNALRGRSLARAITSPA